MEMDANVKYYLNDAGNFVIEKTNLTENELAIFNPEYFRSLGIANVEVSIRDCSAGQTGGAYTDAQIETLTFPYKHFVQFIQPKTMVFFPFQSKAEPTPAISDGETKPGIFSAFMDRIRGMMKPASDKEPTQSVNKDADKPGVMSSLFQPTKIEEPAKPKPEDKPSVFASLFQPTQIKEEPKQISEEQAKPIPQKPTEVVSPMAQPVSDIPIPNIPSPDVSETVPAVEQPIQKEEPTQEDEVQPIQKEELIMEKDQPKCLTAIVTIPAEEFEKYKKLPKEVREGNRIHKCYV
jgi:hypothetical protein